MRINVDIEEFRADRKKYNREHCMNIKRSWEDFHNCFSMMYIEAKDKKAKKICHAQTTIALDNIFNIGLVLNDFDRFHS